MKVEQRRSQTLSDNNYLIRLYITPLGGRGKGTPFFTHGTAGRSFAQSLGKRVPKRFQPIDAKTLNPKHLAHSEDLTDALLSFDHLAKHDDRITVTEMLYERFLFKQRFKVPVRFTHPVTGVIREKQEELIPDAFVKVRAHAGYRIQVERSVSYEVPSAAVRFFTYWSVTTGIWASTRPS